MDPLHIYGIVRPTGNQKTAKLAGYRVRASLTVQVPIDPNLDDTIDVPVTGGGVVDDSGAFAFILLADGMAKTPLMVTVATPEGEQIPQLMSKKGEKVLQREFDLEEASRPLTLHVPTLTHMRAPTLTKVTIDRSKDPTLGERVMLTGRVIDARGVQVAAGVPVILWGVAKDDASATAQPLVICKTQSGGYFSAPWISTLLVSASGRVAGSEPVAIPIEDQRMPRRVLLVLEVPDTENDDGNGPPRVPAPADLTRNPAAFSQDLGRGCINLSTPNRVIEEFSYTTVVRTCEPDVQGITLGLGPVVPPAELAKLVQVSAMREMMMRGSIREQDVAALKDLSLDVATARTLVADDHPPLLADIHRAAWLSDFGRVKDLIAARFGRRGGRQPLDADQAIDWDDTPTLFEAITIAHGHVLEFREVWRADGYSLGDLLYSLPLAPGQRRQIAIVDWERRSVTAREDALDYEEQLDALVSRDRDVAEIVGSRLGEESAGASSSTTWGASGGIGAGFIGTGFGIFGGASGSAGGSNATAWQESSRRFSADSLQNLRDRVMQRASSVRDQRSTTVQSAMQGETINAQTETVANYNRCHAMTVEYFEVLRHFVITHELADVRECLFVPLRMREFDAKKALRWQTPLVANLRDRSLLPAFTALRRIADKWEGWDYPLGRYSTEAPQALVGELRISFVLPRPRDDKDGTFRVDQWKDYAPWLWMDAYELWTQLLEQRVAEFNATEIGKRDFSFRTKVAPELAKRIVDRLRFWYVTSAGSEVEVALDATLVSRYAEGVPLYVSLRPNGALAAVPREQIVQFKISLDGAELPPDGQVIVHSGKVRYQTEHKQWLLFRDDRILNDISNTDPVYVSTPTSWAENRDPHQEDHDLCDRLMAHLNAALEYYHQVIWAWLDAERRFMLLDGILVPGQGGKSIASLVENRLIGIVGNSLIMPLAPGIRIDPRVNNDSEGNLIDLYSVDSPPPLRVSVPTRGVYAEAILGGCEACEEIDDSRYWRWQTEGMLAPPTIDPLDTTTRATPDDPLTPTQLPTPLVSIQNAPDLPTPVGLGEILKILAKPDLFTDITGLEGTQKNARAGFDAALSAVSGVASQAAAMAKQEMTSREGERMLDRIARAQQSGLLSPGAAQDLSSKVFGAMLGTPDDKADRKADSPAADPAVQKALDNAAQADKAAIKVSTMDESIEMSFDGGDTTVGGARSSPGVLDLDQWIAQPVIKETVSQVKTAPAKLFEIKSQTLDTLIALKAAFPTALTPKVLSDFVRARPGAPGKYDLFGRLRIVYPTDPANAKKVGGRGRLPLAVLVHGHHESWQPSEVRNHDGYSYLQEYLAKQGIISVSVDTNAANYFDSLIEMRALIVLEAIDTLRTQDSDKNSRLYRRIDFDRIGLMGHSRGGDAVARVVKLNSGNKHGVIRCIALVAPTDFTGRLAEAQRTSLAASDTGFALVLYGGLDGDVSGMDGADAFGGTGFRHYDRSKTECAMMYVPGCIHNRFNRTWTQDDGGLLTKDLPRVHSRSDHEQLMIEYVGGLFEWKLQGVVARSALFDGRAVNTLGHDTSLQWKWGAQRKWLDDFELPTKATIGPRTLHNCEVKAFADVDLDGTSARQYTSHQTGIAATIKHAAAAVAIEIELPNGQRDWSGYGLLTLRLGTSMDVTNAGTIAAGISPPPLTLTLIDGAGKSGSVSEVAFTTPDIPGKPFFHEAMDFTTGRTVNCTLYRLATVSITLTAFAVNLSDVRKLQIAPTRAFGQRIFIDSLQLVKP